MRNIKQNQIDTNMIWKVLDNPRYRKRQIEWSQRVVEKMFSEDEAAFLYAFLRATRFGSIVMLAKTGLAFHLNNRFTRYLEKKIKKIDNMEEWTEKLMKLSEPVVLGLLCLARYGN